MMTARRKRTEEELRGASDAVIYEWNMLYMAARGILSGVASQSVIHNALIESFITHLRNMIYFFYAEKPDSDHIVAFEFFKPGEWEQLRPDKSEKLKMAERRAHKEVAHISYDRLKTIYSPENKQWDFEGLVTELEPIFKIFARHVPKTLLGKRWQQDE